ncbi:MAG: hypothetical protein JJU34_11705 [Lunatimonas sp.]|uniref:hypothetical protein n=1 Tax=Lunatimonas sp. TaxID=2060141 RepID=UPI00263AF9DA|nr:hypothetical protein [Lunatimonas sp.]MCC5937935.1 hypothetical protein [Lunatimonas sp.]
MNRLINPYACKLLLMCLLTGVSCLFGPLCAQEGPPKPPTPVEWMFGHERMFFQMVVNKKFTPTSRFGLLSVSSFSAKYTNESVDLDMVAPVLLNYSLKKGIALVGGSTVNNEIGFSPVVGAQHSFANKDWLAVSILTFFLNKSQNAELFGIYEYKPSLTPEIGLYTRLQFMYVHGIANGDHARSFLQLRTGVKRQALTFGLGANLDQYGPSRQFKPNYGLFVGWLFQ